MDILFSFLIGLAVYIIFDFIQAILAKKSNYDCFKCKNFICNARFCEQKRRKK